MDILNSMTGFEWSLGFRFLAEQGSLLRERTAVEASHITRFNPRCMLLCGGEMQLRRRDNDVTSNCYLKDGMSPHVSMLIW